VVAPCGTSLLPGNRLPKPLANAQHLLEGERCRAENKNPKRNGRWCPQAKNPAVNSVEACSSGVKHNAVPARGRGEVRQ